MDAARTPDHPPLPPVEALPPDFKPIRLSEGAQADEQWPAPKRRSGPYRSDKPSKHVYFDGPHGEEIRVHIESVSTLTGWSISDTILYFLWRGINAREPEK